ncbi:hypothetical protein QCA50_008718 [Cerrena zonata]|uniref:Major facilitator superfamily (MFS) profile domain-containing protein n=1 Tax=Cerrena zonata TaxID=2478898 RepID=A0AAW0G6A5_9APHY
MSVCVHAFVELKGTNVAGTPQHLFNFLGGAHIQLSPTATSAMIPQATADDNKTLTDVEHIEIIHDEDELLAPEQRVQAEKRLVRLLDMRLLPTIILIFLMNYSDRNALAAARVEGLQDDLHLTDIQYSTVLAVLYVLYIPAQVPSNMILNRIARYLFSRHQLIADGLCCRPSYYIPACTVLWGLTSALTGITKDYRGILAARIALGLPEAAFYPGAVYLLSCWYTRKELALRSAIMYGGSMISNAFSSIIAAGILSSMEGVKGIRAWRWLFFIEGSITITIGFFAIWALPDYTHNTRWLSPSQRRLAQIRLAEDAGEIDEDSKRESALSGLIQALKDPKVPLFGLMTCSQLLGMSFMNFFPTLTSTLGFNTTISLLLAAPPWILTTIISCVNAWHADRTGERYIHTAGWWWIAIVGYIIGLTTASVAGRYVALFLMTPGFSAVPMVFVWVANAVPRPPAKRSAAIGVTNGLGTCGLLIGSFAWKAEWGPDYHPSMFIGIATLVFASFLGLVIRYLLVKANKDFEKKELADLSEAQRKRIEEAAKLEGITVAQAMENKKGFRYLY